MLTTKKKMYASIVMMNEGVIYDNAAVDIKGLAIKKVNTNKNIRAKAEVLLEEEILKADKLRYGKVINEVRKINVEITNSLKDGKVEYLIPGKVNAIENYDFPYRQQPVRGTIIWNTIFPDQEIEIPNKVNTVKIKSITGFNDVAQYMTEEEKDLYYDKFAKLFSNENLLSAEMVDGDIYQFTNIKVNNIDVIAVPDNVKLPNWILKNIDIETMANAHLRPLLPLMESIGFEDLPVNGTLYPSNIVRF
jgi:hypothetical protein